MYEKQGVVLCAGCHCVLWQKHGRLCAACKEKHRPERDVAEPEPEPATGDEKEPVRRGHSK